MAGIIPFHVIRTQAQTGDSTWSQPLNLSKSGSGSNPKMVVDSDGRIHVYWLDAFDGVIYTSRDLDGNWFEPIPTSVPFEDSFDTLTFLPDPRGFIHAIWIDKAGSMFYARTGSNQAPLAWGTSRFISSSTIGFHAVLDEKNTLHLAYVDTESATAGIYYRSFDDVRLWTNPVSIYKSPYFRGITFENAHVWVVPTRDDRIFITWDDPYKEQVLLSWSMDGGQNWTGPGVVDQREERDGLESTGPSQGMVYAINGDIRVLWQAGHGGSICSQYATSIPADHQTITGTLDATPSLELERQILSNSIQGCPLELKLLENEIDTTLLLVKSSTGLQLSAWRGPDLGQFYFQDELSGFTNPETFRRVSFDCHQVDIHQGFIYVVSCEAGKVGDIWFLERSLGSAASWFPTPTPSPLWSTPAVISPGDQEVSSPVLLTSSEGRKHALWIGNNGKIFYSYFDGSHWLQPSVVATSPGERAGNLSAVMDRNSNIFLLWDVPDNSALFYIWVPETNALSPAAWSSPREVPLPYGGRSPDVYAGMDGGITIVYAVPVNEGRGIYFTNTQNKLNSSEIIQWNPPTRVVDASETGWSMVDNPHLATNQDGQLFTLWTNYAPPPAGTALGLYFSSYVDGALSEPKEMVKGEVISSEILAGSDHNIHILWKEVDGRGGAALWHRYSTDQGISWSDPIRIVGLPNDNAQEGFVLDANGTLQLVLVSPSEFISIDGESTLVLENLVFDGLEWSPDERLNLSNITNPVQLSAETSIEGDLAALLLAEITGESETSDSELALFFSQRPVNGAEVHLSILPTFTPQPTTTQAPPPPEPSPTPKLEFSAEASPQNLPIFSNRWTTIIVSGLPAAFIVIWALVYGLRKLRK